MAGSDVASWTDFGVAVAGGSAALAGLLFVAVSLNVKEILGVPGLASRAAANLALLITILLIAVYLVVPEQDRQVLGAEIVVTSIPLTVAALRVGSHRRAGRRLTWSLASLLLLVAPPLLLIVGGTSLILGGGGGLYWVTAAVAAGFATSALNAWVMLVQVHQAQPPDGP